MKFLLQLKTASECGITIPTTLCSNDPEEIRLFILKHQANGIIYKPLSSEDKHLNMPKGTGIFQKDVKKLYELRVICFRNYLMAAKMQSNADDQLLIEPCRMPDDLAVKIRTFMQTLGIVFGTCDFIVTPNKEYIFLELSEQGIYT